MPDLPLVARSASHPLALRLGGFELNIEGPVEHDANDTWDASWLATTATCDAPGAAVSASGIVVTSWSVRRFSDGLAELIRTGQGCALLAAEGPELSVCARGTSQPGRIAVRIDVTPTHETQGHWFVYHVEASQLPAIMAQCQAILGAFPAREMETHPT